MPSPYIGARPYQYMHHLRELDQRQSTLPDPPWLQAVASTLKPEFWAWKLANHQDQAFRDYTLSGITQGFRVGFNYAGCCCKPAASNMVSARENSEMVQAYLDMEVALG